MTKATLKDTIRAYARGAATVQEVLTHREWLALAKSTRSRFSAPDAVDAEDFAQELRMHAWEALQKADPERGDPGAFVVYHAFARARRWYERQQGQTAAYPGIKFLPTVAAVTTPETVAGAFDVPVDADQEARAVRRATVERMLAGLTPARRSMVESFVASGGDLSLAAERMIAEGHRGPRRQLANRIFLAVEAAATTSL